MLPDSVIESLLASFSPDSTPKRPTAVRSSTGGNDVFTAFLQRARARISYRPSTAAPSDTSPTSDASALRLVTSGAFNPTFVDVKPTSDSAVSSSAINKVGIPSEPPSETIAQAAKNTPTSVDSAVSGSAPSNPADAELEQILAVLPRVVAELFGLDPAAQAELLQSFASAIESGESLNMNPEPETDSQSTSAQTDARQPVKQSKNSWQATADQISSEFPSQPAQQQAWAAIDPALNQQNSADHAVSAQVHNSDKSDSVDEAVKAGQNAPSGSRKAPLENPEKAAFVNHADAGNQSLSPSRVATLPAENQSDNSAREVVQPEQQSIKQNNRQTAQPASAQSQTTNAPVESLDPRVESQNVNKTATAPASTTETTIFKVEFVDGRAQIEAPGLNTTIDSAANTKTGRQAAESNAENFSSQQNAAVRNDRPAETQLNKKTAAETTTGNQSGTSAQRAGRGLEAKSALPKTNAQVQSQSQSDSAHLPARANAQTSAPATVAPQQAEIVLNAPLRDGHREILPRTLRIDLDGSEQSTVNTPASAPARASNALARLASLLSAVRELGGDIQSIRITAVPTETPNGATSGAQSGYLQPPALSASVIQALRDIAAGRPAPLQAVIANSGTPLAEPSVAETGLSQGKGSAERAETSRAADVPFARANAKSLGEQPSSTHQSAAGAASSAADERSQAKGVQSRGAASGADAISGESDLKQQAGQKSAASGTAASKVAPSAAAKANVAESLPRNPQLKTDERAQPNIAPGKQQGAQASATADLTQTADKADGTAVKQSATVRSVEVNNSQQVGDQAAPQSLTDGKAKQADSSPQAAIKQEINVATAANGRRAQTQSPKVEAQPRDAQTHSADAQLPQQQAGADEKLSAKSGLNRRVETQTTQPQVKQPVSESASQPQAVKQTVAPASQQQAQSGDVQSAAKAETARPVVEKSTLPTPPAQQPEVNESAAPRVSSQPQDRAASNGVAKTSAESGNLNVRAAAPVTVPQATVKSSESADANTTTAREVKSAAQSQATSGEVFLENANLDNKSGKRQVAQRDVAAPQSPSAKSAESAQPKDNEPVNPQSPRRSQSDKPVVNTAVAAPTDEQASVKQSPQREVLQPTKQKSVNRPNVSQTAAETGVQPRRGLNPSGAETAAQASALGNNAAPQAESTAENKAAFSQAQSESAAPRPAQSVNVPQSGQSAKPTHSADVVAQNASTQPQQNVPAQPPVGDVKTVQADQPRKTAQNLSGKRQSQAVPVSTETPATAESVKPTVAVKQGGTNKPEASTQPESRSVHAKQQTKPTDDAGQQQPASSDSENVKAPSVRRETIRRTTSAEPEVKIAQQVKNSESASARPAARESLLNAPQTAPQSARVDANKGEARAATTDNTKTDVAPARTETAPTKSTLTPDPLDSGSVVNKKIKPEATPAPEAARTEVSERAVKTPAREVKNAGAEHLPKPAVQPTDPAIKQTAQPEQPTKQAGDALNKASAANAPEAESKERQAEVKNQPRIVNKPVDTSADTRRGAALDIAAEVFRKSAKTMADPTGSTEMLRRAAEQLRQTQQPVRPNVPPVKIDTPRVERVPLRPSAETSDVQIANVPLKQANVNAAQTAQQTEAPLLNSSLGAETPAMFARTAAEEQRPAQEQAQQQVQERRAEQNKVQQQNVAPRAAEEAAARELRPRTVVHEKSFNDSAVPRVSDQSALDGEENSGDGSGKQSGNYSGEQKGEQSASPTTQQAEVQAAAQRQSVNNGAPQRFDEVLREQAQARRAFAPAPTAAERRAVEGRTAERTGTGHERVMKTLRRVAVHRWADTTFGALRTLPAGRGAAIAMTLNPENLGSVMVELTINKGVASIKIQTERAETRRILEQHAVALKDKLVQSGMSVDNLEINVRDGDLRQDARGELAGDRRRNEREEQSARQEFVDSFRYLREEEAAPPRPAERVPAATAADGFERYA